MTNALFAKDQSFIDSCRFVGISATKRQASKYRLKMGKVYKITKDPGHTSRRKEN